MGVDSANWAYLELRGARLWDGRCLTSLTHACERLADQANVSLSRALGSCRKAFSHILHHQKVTAKDLLNGHTMATASWCVEYVDPVATDSGADRSTSGTRPLILVASDTTTLDFTSHKSVEGLGPTTDKKHKSRGFFAHSALALTTEGVPLGLLYQHSWVRESKPSETAKEKREYSDKESYKWLEALRGVEAAVANLLKNQSALLVQDQEADIFGFFAASRQQNIDLLIRATQPRRVEAVMDEEEPLLHTLMKAVAQAPIVASKTVAIHARPDREARDAKLTVRLLHCTLRFARL